MRQRSQRLVRTVAIRSWIVVDFANVDTTKIDSNQLQYFVQELIEAVRALGSSMIYNTPGECLFLSGSQVSDPTAVKRHVGVHKHGPIPSRPHCRTHGRLSLRGRQWQRPYREVRGVSTYSYSFTYVYIVCYSYKAANPDECFSGDGGRTFFRLVTYSICNFQGYCAWHTCDDNTIPP